MYSAVYVQYEEPIKWKTHLLRKEAKSAENPIRIRRVETKHYVLLWNRRNKRTCKGSAKSVMTSVEKSTNNTNIYTSRSRTRPYIKSVLHAIMCISLEGEESGKSINKATNVILHVRRNLEKAKTRTWEEHKQFYETWSEGCKQNHTDLKARA